MCARPPTLWDGCSLFLSSKEKGLKGTACGRWGEEMESLRVGLPSNHPVLTLPWQHSSSIAYVLRPAGSVKCRALGIPRPAVPFEQLAEPRKAWRVCTGQRGETQKEMARLLCGPGCLAVLPVRLVGVQVCPLPRTCTRGGGHAYFLAPFWFL